jgi:hypothetical protein
MITQAKYIPPAKRAAEALGRARRSAGLLQFRGTKLPPPPPDLSIGFPALGVPQASGPAEARSCRFLDVATGAQTIPEPSAPEPRAMPPAGMVLLPLPTPTRAPVEERPTAAAYQKAAQTFVTAEQCRRDESVASLGPHSRWYGVESLHDPLEDSDIIESWTSDGEGGVLDEFEEPTNNQHSY